MTCYGVMTRLPRENLAVESGHDVEGPVSEMSIVTNTSDDLEASIADGEGDGVGVEST